MVPLDGVKVVDFTHVLAGPYATMLLADLGAEVVKIERPGHGDETRGWGPPSIDGMSAYFHAVNRGKRSVSQDLRTEEGRAVIKSLVAEADVVVENFRPGSTQRLGIDYESLSAINPRLVYASITGFGSSGPMAMTPGTEVVVEAYSGLMDITGERDGKPVRFGVAMVDLATGLAATAGIVAALLERNKNGQGRKLEFSLYATALSCLGTVITTSSAEGAREPAERWGTGHPSIVPYSAFPAMDGAVVLGAISDPMWQRLCDALDMPEAAAEPKWLANEMRVKNRAEVEAAVAARIATMTVEEAVATLDAHKVLVAPVLSVNDAMESEQASALDTVFEYRGTLFARSVLNQGGRILDPAPSLGQHTDEVLGELIADNDQARKR